MGRGIAQACASAGLDVLLYDVAPDVLVRALDAVGASLAKFSEKGTLSQGDAQATLARLRTTTSLDELRACDLVIEAIIENMPQKQTLFTALDALLRPEALICSNTSSLCIIEMASVTKRPSKVAGLHFFNPVPLMKLVEIVKSIATSQATIDSLYAFAARLGKRAILAKDTPGFIVNRLLVPYLLYAVRALQDGVASREDIDEGMKLGCAHPMGPLTLIDFVGVDTTFYIAEIMFNELKDPVMAPPPLLRRMVLAGHYGRKTGKGFYDYA